jgi:hypothetical protein
MGEINSGHSEHLVDSHPIYNFGMIWPLLVGEEAGSLTLCFDRLSIVENSNIHLIHSFESMVGMVFDRCDVLLTTRVIEDKWPPLA